MNEKKILFEKFEIIDTLKKDSQSGVYLANHVYLNKKIILKILNTQLQRDKTKLERFKREAKILARLDHPNIIKVLDFGTYSDFFYLSFEYFDSKTLREYLQKNLPNEKEFFKIITQILLGLSYAHSQKIIHRDLKPENILIDKNLRVKIADFGLALSEKEMQVTQQESIVGTPGYMSPEQIRSEILDQRSDIFSFGIIAYELLTGQNPFIGKDVTATINNILFLDSEKIKESLIAKNFKYVKVILKCLQKNRENRFLSTYEILSEFEFELDKQPFEQPERKSREYSKIFLTLILMVIVVLTIFLLFTGPDKSEQNNNQSSITLTEKPELSLEQKNENHKSDKDDQKTTSPTKMTENKEIFENEKNAIKKELSSSTSKLMITCYPWAEISINDRKVETTPLTKPIELPAGKFELKLIHPDFPPIIQDIELEADSMLNLEFNFYKIFGFIQFQIIPWAEITVNDKKIGITPIEKPLGVKKGKNILRIMNPKFGVLVDTIFVQPAETIFYKLNLNNVTYQAQ